MSIVARSNQIITTMNSYTRAQRKHIAELADNKENVSASWLRWVSKDRKISRMISNPPSNVLSEYHWLKTFSRYQFVRFWLRLKSNWTCVPPPSPLVEATKYGGGRGLKSRPEWWRIDCVPNFTSKSDTGIKVQRDDLPNKEGIPI